jgi:hypothetical protein
MRTDDGSAGRSTRGIRPDSPDFDALPSPTCG